MISCDSSAGSAAGATTAARVRPAVAQDVDAIIRLLQAGLDARLSPETWQRLFEYPEASNHPNLGFVLESGDRLVGFLGAIYSERLLNGRIERFCNLSSWYTVQEFRSSSLSLLMALLSQSGYTFTTLTPSPVAINVLTAFGFRRLETDKLLFGSWLFRKLLHRKIATRRRERFYKAQRVVEILSEPAILKSIELLRGSPLSMLDSQRVRMLAGIDFVRPYLAPADQKILDDHPRCGHFLVHNQQSYSYAVTTNRVLDFSRRSLKDIVVSEILHLSSPDLALRQWPSLCKLIINRNGSHGLLVDKRMVGSDGTNDLLMPDNAYFMTGNGLSPNEIDSLYSEIPLLELSFYV